MEETDILKELKEIKELQKTQGTIFSNEYSKFAKKFVRNEHFDLFKQDVINKLDHVSEKIGELCDNLIVISNNEKLNTEWRIEKTGSIKTLSWVLGFVGFATVMNVLISIFK